MGIYESWNSVYTPEPGEVEKARCGICNYTMDVRRNVPRSYRFSSNSYQVDWFECTHKDENWHKQAEILQGEYRMSNSASIRKILLAEIEEIIKCRKPTIEKKF